MRGVDWLVFSENTNVFRLGLLKHVLELCKLSFVFRLADVVGLMCLDAVCFKKQQQRRADYGFHAYMELCQLVYCLLSRSRRVSSLPNAWEEYMDVTKLSQYDGIPTAEFLQNYDFGAVLREFKGSEGRDFQDRCRVFIDHFVELILAQQAASSVFTSGLYCFCPELLLEGDDKHVFDLFNRLARRLERCGVI